MARLSLGLVESERMPRREQELLVWGLGCHFKDLGSKEKVIKGVVPGGDMMIFDLRFKKKKKK